ncbi:MAG: DUF2029 domain-containing protein [Planctomycetes bacterium]|nr:DUF2029 domain-containing protein [Planctomycetota bacterium]
MDNAPRTTFLSERVRYALAWLLLLGGLAFGLHRSWHFLDKPERRDGNEGHVSIDFGGQWLMGRMLLEGHARRLYDRGVQRQLLRRAFPREDEAPDQEISDVDDLLSALMGHDEGVGGPLYPPLNAFVMAPLALLPPRPAYRVGQLVNVLLIFLCALWMVRLSEGTVWWPLATLLLTGFPGFGGSLNLAQNSTLSLTILLGGWMLLMRGREAWAGAVWGLLAFKPVWVVAFFLVPLLTGRWRMATAMLATGAGLALATVPVAGVGAWLDWLQVGREGDRYYEVVENWINQGRDLSGAARRWMLDFSQPYEELRRTGLVPTVIGWGLLLAVLEVTVRLTLLRRSQARAMRGPAAAFVLLGAWLSCYHFLYYDVLLAALPVALLYLTPCRWRERSFWLDGRDRPPALLVVLIVVMPNVRYVLPGIQPRMQVPWEQYLLIVLWLWCARCWTHQRGTQRPSLARRAEVNGQPPRR